MFEDDVWQTARMPQQEIASGGEVNIADVKALVLDTAIGRGDETALVRSAHPLADYYRRTLVNPASPVPHVPLQRHDIDEMVQNGCVAMAIHFIQRIDSSAIHREVPPLEAWECIEGLGRLIHPTGQVIGFGSIEKAAGDARILDRISFEIMRQACLFASAVQRITGRKISVSVNVSPTIAWLYDLRARVEQILQDTHIEAPCLVLEFLEKNRYLTDQCCEALRALVRLGVRIAVDDYGKDTSRAFFEQLRSHHIPVHMVKFEGELLRDIRHRLTEVQTYLHNAHSGGAKAKVWEGYPQTRMKDIAFLRALRKGSSWSSRWSFEGRAFPDALSVGDTTSAHGYYTPEEGP